MDLNSVIGKTVRITLAGVDFQDPYLRPRIGSGEPTLTMVTQIESVDELGIWIKVQDFPVFDNVVRHREQHVAFVLLRYEYISSIVHFPEVEEDASKPGRIGFIFEEAQ